MLVYTPPPGESRAEHWSSQETTCVHLKVALVATIVFFSIAAVIAGIAAYTYSAETGIALCSLGACLGMSANLIDFAISCCSKKNTIICSES